MRQWRLITDEPTSGAANMARDEAILQAVTGGVSLPTLRLYAWSPACLSLGYGQRARDVDFARLTERGWDIVRRPTGGRAILHTNELTYSVALRADDPLAEGGIIESYRRISMALAAALEMLGVGIEANPKGEAESGSGAVCFDSTNHYEITVNGRKLVGSAQARRGGGVLQHGSLPLTGDISRICDVLDYADEAQRAEAKAQVCARAVTLEQALGGQLIDWKTAADAVARGFAQVFDVTFVDSGLTADETDAAARIERDVYGSAAWTMRR